METLIPMHWSAVIGSNSKYLDYYDSRDSCTEIYIYIYKLKH